MSEHWNRPAADSWRVPLEGHIRRCVDHWVRSLDDGELMVASDQIAAVLDVARLLCQPPEGAGSSDQSENQEQAS